MPICDICGKAISQSKVNVVSPGVIVRATEMGYVPAKLPLDGLTSSFGISRADAWRGTVQRYSTAEWGLCFGCLGEVRAFGGEKRSAETVVRSQRVSSASAPSMPEKKRSAETPVQSRPASSAPAPSMPKKKWWQFWK